MRLRCGLFLLAVAVAAFVCRFYAPSWRHQVEIRPVGEQIRLYRHATGRVEILPLEEYVVGVVAAEMPAAFPLEALKAQAVAARTYALRRILGGGVANRLHPEADLCDDPRHGQAYLDREELKRRWGPLGYYRYYYRVRRAVEETEGLVLTYQGQLIEPVYHASCGGRTESAGEIWQVDLPYLRSVPCPYDAYPEPVEKRSFGITAVERALFPDEVVIPAAAGGGKLFTMELARVTATGRPKEVVINGVAFRATEVRERLGLKSSRFTWRIEGDRLCFTTIGYGHGVGLCQYGAKGMAAHGYNFRQILTHYYSGVKVTKYPGV